MFKYLNDQIENELVIGLVGFGWFGSNFYDVCQRDKIQVVIIKSEEQIENVDIVFECTGDVLYGFKIASACLIYGKDFVTVNSELDATVGYHLAKEFEKKDLIYSNSYGDQPGVLYKLIEELKFMGFKICSAGNCKGFLDRYANPNTVTPYIDGQGKRAKMVASFADGTKQAMELAVVANCFDLNVEKRGCLGKTLKKDEILKEYGNLDGKVEYTLGTIDNYGSSVFVIAEHDKKKELNYLKMGDGPRYLFFKDYHLCFFETLTTILEVMYLRESMVQKYQNCGVYAFAKTDMHAIPLEGIGGFACYGLIDNVDKMKLPVGLSAYCTLKRRMEKDMPITLIDVDMEENEVTEFWYDCNGASC